MARSVVLALVLLIPLGTACAQAVEIRTQERTLDSLLYSDFHWRNVRVQLDADLLRLDPAVHGVVFGLPPAAPLGAGPFDLNAVAREVWLFDPGVRPESAAIVVEDERLAEWFSARPPLAVARVHVPETYLRPDSLYQRLGQEYVVKVWSEADATGLVGVLQDLDGIDYAHRQVSNCSIRVGGQASGGCYESQRRARSLVRLRPTEAQGDR